MQLIKLISAVIISACAMTLHAKREAVTIAIKDLPKLNQSITSPATLLLPQTNEQDMYSYASKDHTELYRVLIKTVPSKVNVEFYVRKANAPSTTTTQTWKKAFTMVDVNVADLEAHKIGNDNHIVLVDEKNDGKFTIKVPGDTVTVSQAK